MKKLVVILILMVFVFTTGIATADDYKINEQVEQDLDDHNEIARVVIGYVVLIVIYAVACELIVKYANETPLSETIQE
jgi:uncharacterized protein YacL